MHTYFSRLMEQTTTCIFCILHNRIIPRHERRNRSLDIAYIIHMINKLSERPRVSNIKDDLLVHVRSNDCLYGHI